MRDLLAAAARRAGDYLGALGDRPAGADPESVQRLVRALGRPHDARTGRVIGRVQRDGTC